MAVSRTKRTRANSNNNRIEKMLTVLTKGQNKTNQRLDHLETEFQKIHQTLILIENDHGDKIKIFSEGLSANNQRLDRVENGLRDFGKQMTNRFDRLDGNFIDFKNSITHVANDHETRLGVIENSFQAHIEKHT